MEDKNFTIIEDIFDSDDSNVLDIQKKDFSFIRTTDSNSIRQPYPSSNILSLSYDEDMIRNKLSRQINPRVLASEYNSMNNTNRILQPQPLQPSPPIAQNIKQTTIQKEIVPVMQPIHTMHQTQMSCRAIYDHIENCPICNRYYKQSNRTYILIIIFLVLIILLLIRQK